MIFRPNKMQFVTVLALWMTVYTGKGYAQGNLLVTPKRVVLENSKRSEELNLANTGNDSATYDISFIQIRMNEDGSFEKISQPDSAQYFADKNIRFFPRSVTLGPKESQTVRVQVTKTDQLQPGEYRSHLYLRAVPPQKPQGEIDINKDSAISVHLVPIFGISIPVIIRVGETDAQVKFSDLAFRMENSVTPSIDIKFNRTGNRSLYGDVRVDYISPTGKTVEVGLVRGVALYTPYATRHFRMKLEKKSGVDFKEGKLHVLYTDQSKKPVKLAEDELVLK